MAPVLRVLSLGAGVQSTTLALMAAAGELGPMPDCAIFADTQWEPAAVYAHLDRLNAALPFPVHRVTAGDLKAAILARRNTSSGRYAAVPWYVTNPDGSQGMGRRQCTSEYKLKPITRQIRALLGNPTGRIPAGAVEQWVGISADEATRMRPAAQQFITTRWPLVERHLTRDHCLTWLRRAGWHDTPKSACVGCPFHNAAAWRQMRDESPADFADAVAIDAQLRVGATRGIRGVEYMHARRIPLADAVARQSPTSENLNLFENECMGLCGV